MSSLRIAWATAADFLVAWDAEIARGGLLLRGAAAPSAVAGSPCPLVIAVGDAPEVEVAAQLAAVIPGVGIAVMFTVPPALSQLAEAARTGKLVAAAPAPPAAKPQGEEEEDARPGSLFERLRGMTSSEKTALALSGQRDERIALLRDPMKPVHVFVLKNPRIGIDEVQYAAKLASLSPDALKLIAEHREWGMNVQVCVALVRNPKMPIPLALRLLERVPVSELKAIAKGGARDQIVQAARKRLGEGR